MTIKDVTAVIDAKAIKRYCDSKRANGVCIDDCVFYSEDNYCVLPYFLGLHNPYDKKEYMDAKAQIDKKLNELSK